VKERCEVVRSSFQLGLLAIALGVGVGCRPASPDQIDQVLADAGKRSYDKYCTPCHGPGGAPGEAVYRATKQPVDLRTYVQRHGGKFPVADWLAVIEDVRPDSVHAAVWESIQRSQFGMIQDNVGARGMLGSIARYINSVQTK
jgi:hypothetical protein